MDRWAWPARNVYRQPEKESVVPSIKRRVAADPGAEFVP
jgi:hypothetical protein